MASRFIDSGSITFKALMIGMIVLMLLVPLTMLRGLVNERASLARAGLRASRRRLGR